MVWPNFFLMNVFFALKQSKLFIIINQVVEAKRFEGCSYVEKYAEFKNQTLKNLEYHGGTLYPASNLTYLSHPEQFLMDAKLFPGSFSIKKILFINKNLFRLCESAWLPWKPIMLFSRMWVYLQNQSYLICYLP